MLHTLKIHLNPLSVNMLTGIIFLSIEGEAAVHSRDWTVARKSFRKACLIRPYDLLCHLRYGASFFQFIAIKIWK